MVDLILHPAIPRIILDEHLDLFPYGFRQIETLSRVDGHAECVQESNCESLRLAIEIPVDRDIRERRIS
jgi:hypothetical protein